MANGTNTTTGVGGGLYNNNYSSPWLINVTIAGNRTNFPTGFGGGIFSDSTNSNPSIRNSIIWGNTVVTTPSAIDGNTSFINNSLVEGGTLSTDSGNINAGSGEQNSPFVPGGWKDPANGTVPNSEGNYWLKEGSPAIGAGNSGHYPNTWGKWSSSINGGNPIGKITGEAAYNEYIFPYIGKDLAGENRNPLTSTIDMGAYEYSE
jgi:hypothetical protein